MAKHNSNFKQVGAKEIYDYLKSCADSKGIATKTRKDIAQNFGYKSSNGDGFIANLNFLEANKLIEDVSDNKKAAVWKVNTKKGFKFPKGPIVNKMAESVDLEKLVPMSYDNRRYVPLTSISESLGIDRRYVYNSTNSTNKMIAPFVRMVENKKCIEVEGLSYLFTKLKSKIRDDVFITITNYLDTLYNEDTTSDSDMDSNDDISGVQSAMIIDVEEAEEVKDIAKDSTTPKSHAKSTVKAKSNSKTKKETKSVKKVTEDVAKETVVTATEKDTTKAESSNKKNIAKVEKHKPVIVEEIVEEVLTDDTPLSASSQKETLTGKDQINEAYDDINFEVLNEENIAELLEFFDKLSAVLVEHSELKTKVETLKAENARLASENSGLTGMADIVNKDNVLIKELEDKVASLQKQLHDAKKLNVDLITKASMIKDYIYNRKASSN